MSNLSAGSLQRGLVLDMPLRKKYMKSSVILTDRTPYGNDGTVEGAVVGELGTRFDGVDDYVNCGNDSSLNFTTNSFTLEAWIKTDYTGVDRPVICDKGGFLTGYYFRNNQGSNGLYEIKIDDGTNDYYAQTVINYNDGDWHYIVGVVDGRTSMKFYVDGVEDYTNYSMTGSVLSDVGSISNSASLTIGERNTGINFFNGLIDSVRIYNRALSAIEIEQSYRDGKWEHS